MVQVTQHAVRVYGSAAYKPNNSSDVMQLRPITLDPYILDDMGSQGRAFIYLGAPVAWVKDASEIRQAIGHMILSMLSGTPLSPDPELRIKEAMEAIDTDKGWQDPWYVTIVLEQDFTVPDDAITGNEYLWLDSDIPVYARAENYQQITTPHLDRLATLASTIVASDAFEEVVVANHVFFSTAGRRTFGWPQLHTSVNAQISHSLDNLDFAAIEARLRQATMLTKSAFDWLDLVIPWWLAGLREQDSWRAFVQLFAGLELLHSRLVKRYYSRVIGSSHITASDLASRKTSPILSSLFNQKDVRTTTPCSKLFHRGEFAILALALFPTQADADFNVFESIKKVRDAVAHGEQTIEKTTFPLLELRTLFGRYLDAAIQEHLTPSAATP